MWWPSVFSGCWLVVLPLSRTEGHFLRNRATRRTKIFPYECMAIQGRAVPQSPMSPVGMFRDAGAVSRKLVSSAATEEVRQREKADFGG